MEFMAIVILNCCRCLLNNGLRQFSFFSENGKFFNNSCCNSNYARGFIKLLEL